MSVYLARIGVSCRRSRLQVAVGCTPKWTDTCSRPRRQESGRLLFHRLLLKKKHCCGRPDAVEHTQLKRRVLATATLRFRPVCVDTDCWIAFFADDTGVSRRQTLIHTAFCRSCELLTELCIKPMRYVYHPQRNCYFVVTLPLCCRP